MEEQIVQYYDFGEFRLDQRRRTLLKNGEKVQISARLFDLLLTLIQNEGRILEHDELLDKVWGETFVEQSNLKKGISALRQVLGELPNQSLYIKTIPRRGYCFVTPVRAVAAETENLLVRRTEREIIVEEIEEYDDEAAVDETRNFIEIEPTNTSATASRVIEYPALPAAPKTSFKKWQIIFPAVLLLLLVSLGGYWLWHRYRENSFTRLNSKTLRAQKFTTSGNIYESGISPDGKMIAYAQVEDNGMQSLWLRRIGVPNTLQIASPEKVEYQAIVFSPDNNSVYCGITLEGSRDVLNRISILGGSPRRITEGIHSAATFSPDGKRFAFIRDSTETGRTLYTADSEDGNNEQKVVNFADSHNFISPLWSPDGKHFVYISSENTEKGRIWELKEMPVGGGEARLLTIPQRGKIYTINWLRDGSGLLMSADSPGSIQAQLWRVSYPGGEISRLTNDVADYGTVEASADGKVILTKASERTSDLWIADIENPAGAKRYTTTQNITNRFAILPDGKFLAEAVENGQAGIYIVDSKGNLQLFSPNGQYDRNPDLSADGQTVYFISKRTGSEQIWQANPAGGNLKQLTNDQTFLYIPKISPDGQTLYYLKFDNTHYNLMKIPAAGGQATAVSNEEIELFDISPDGKFILYSYLDKTKKHWQTVIMDSSNNQIIKQFDIFPSSSLTWAPDGKSFFYTTSDIFREGGNIWRQSIDGGQPVLFLNTEPDKVFGMNFSADGRQIYFTRGKTVSNLVVLLQGDNE